METYYDYTASPSSPLNTGISTVSYDVKLNYYDSTRVHIEIQENEVVYLNGTTQKFYSIGNIYQQTTPDQSYYGFYNKDECYITLSNKKKSYIQYNHTQPVFARRNLGDSIYTNTTLISNTTTTTNTVTTTMTYSMGSTDIEKEEMTLKYYIFYSVACVGGIFAIGRVIISIVIGYYAQKAYNFKIANNYRQYSGTTESSGSAVAPKSFLKSKNNRSFKNEFDPLVMPQGANKNKNQKVANRKGKTKGLTDNLDDSFAGLVDPAEDNGVSPQSFGRSATINRNTSMKYNTNIGRKSSSKRPYTC